MIYLKVSSASQEIPLGYFVSGTDGNTELTSLTIANTDIKLWKNGATSLVNKNSGGATHMSSGIYYAVLDTVDTNTLGSLLVYSHPAGSLPCKTDCVVLSANIFDSFIGATSTLIVGSVTGAVASVTGNVGGSVLGSVSYVAGSVLGNVLGSVGSVSGALTLGDIIDGIWDEPVADHTTTATTGKALTSTGTATVDPTDIWSYTTRTLTSSGTASIDYTQVENAVWNAQRSSHVSSGTFGEGVNVSGAITLGTIVDGIWDEALSGHSTSGTAGHQLASTVTSSGTVYLNIGEAEIADAVWNAQTSDYIVTGSMGRALTSTGTAVIDASDVWNYSSRTLTSTGVSDATLANQEIIIQHLTDIKGDDWTDEDLVAIMTAIENGTWGGFGI
jgi:hypothetical protein